MPDDRDTQERDGDIPPAETGNPSGLAWPIAKFVMGFVGGGLLAALNVAEFRSHELARQAMCLVNVKGIVTAVAAYANESHEERMPPDLDSLVREEFLESESFVCPASGTVPVSDVPGNPPLAGHCDYVYAGPLSWTAPQGLPMVFELPLNHGQRMANVGCTDGSSRACRDSGEFVASVQRTNDFIRAEREGGR
jgi:hypothetical protein